MRIRGGKTSKSSARKSSVRASSASSRRRASFEKDDDEDEEDSDDREPPRKSKAKVASKQKGKTASKGRGNDKRSKMELIPWGQPAGGRKGKAKTLGLREKLEDLAKHGQSAYKDVYRRAKVRRYLQLTLARSQGDQVVTYYCALCKFFHRISFLAFNFIINGCKISCTEAVKDVSETIMYFIRYENLPHPTPNRFYDPQHSRACS